MAKICVTLGDAPTVELVDRMVDLAPVADLFEIRGDTVPDLDLLTLLRARDRPLLFTCRAASHGGRWEQGEQRRRRLLLEAVKRGFDYVDVEHDSGFMEVMLEKTGHGLVVSHHDFEGTPEDLGGLYGAMSARGADVVKLVVTPRSIADVARLIGLAARVGGGRVPLVPIALGPMGLLTRVVAGRFGAPFTYASARRGAELAAGQIPAAWMSDVYRVRQVSPATRVYGVLGASVADSLSPAIHNRAFAVRKLDAVYVPLQAEALTPFLAALPALGLSGFSVTRPYKVPILEHLQEVEEQAARCGSVNTVTVHDGLLRGSTTDGTGVLWPLRQRLDVKGQHVVVLGAGGAARAAASALRHVGAQVTVLARRREQAAAVARAVGCAHGDWDTLDACYWDVLVNATPLNSVESPDRSPVPAHLHRKGAVVLDMVYDPLETRLLLEARAGGSSVIDGVEMLVAQAAGQFETWTGLEAPLDEMRQAALSYAEALAEAR